MAEHTFYKEGNSEHPIDRSEGACAPMLFIPAEQIKPNPDQPRKHFDEKSLDDLAASILERGLLQPIIVKRSEQTGCFLLIAGERRYRAFLRAQKMVENPDERLKKIPAIIRKEDPLELALIENMQREDLNPLEMAEGIKQLADRFGYTQEALAKRLNINRRVINESLQLTKLPDEIKADFRKEPYQFSKKVMLTVAREKSPDKTRDLWEAVKEEKLTVREAQDRSRKNKQFVRRNRIDVFCDKYEQLTEDLIFMETANLAVKDTVKIIRALEEHIAAAQGVVARLSR